ncbi:MAG TPA: peptidase domain-containing ABC transporter [Saprospiraceae bacterium]|nr:peptidase domain-containing ABC transporter [Saprospiraceae bacterium]
MFRTFPFYQQLDAMECGAACLKMIAKHYGRYYSMERLRGITYQGREGVSLLGISDAAEEIGLQTLAVQTTFDQLVSVIPLPCIAHWNDEEHFVVIYRATKNYVWIADPQEGKFKLPKAEFLQHWASSTTRDGEAQGILLLLQVTPEFYQQEGDKVDKSGFRYVLSYFGQYKGLLVQLGLGLLLGIIIMFILPFLIQSVVDIGIGNLDVPFIQLVLVCQLLLFSTQIAVDYFRSWILLHLSVRVNITLVSDYLFKLTKLPISYFNKRQSGDLLQRINDHERIQRFMSSTSLSAFFYLVNYLVFGVILAMWSPPIFWVFLGGTLLYIGWVLFFARKKKDVDYRHFDEAAENQNSLIELINGMQDIKLYNAEKSKRWSWERIQARLFRTSLSTMRLQQYQRIGARFFNETKNVLIIFLAVIAVKNSNMTIGTLVAIIYILGMINSQITALIEFLVAYQEAKISLERIDEIHQIEDEEKPGEKITLLPKASNLELDDVYFQYSGPHSPVILKNLRLNIPKGKVTAIVGRSGSGKSTLMKLLLQFYQPTEGSIRVGKVNLGNISPKVWRGKCGVVMQDSFIFSDSIAKNVALGEEIIDKDRLLEAVELANIRNFVEALPLAYDTRIGASGLGLSQGQKQRLLIARAIYKNPDYLFFDEATTALDAFGEMVVMENLKEKVFYDKTVVIIAHRLSTVRDADHIIVLENGEVAEQGQHDDLTFRRGAYFQLVRNQLELGA